MVGRKEKGECHIPLVTSLDWGFGSELNDAELEF